MLIYDMTLKFESEIFVNHFDKEFQSVLQQLGGPISNFGQNIKLEHDIKISNSPVLPDENFIDIIKNNIMDALISTFENSSSINAKVIGIKYIGITTIKQRESKD